MNPINLSYVMTTYNKLPYLKEVMKRLLENVKEDEEIVVVDGASNDGTVEYLVELYKQGKINQFISEPDKGEAHGYNKGLLMAKGSLIKIITDDDAFYYPGIQECKNFMLEHSEIDVLSGNVANMQLGVTEPDKVQGYQEQYENWKSYGYIFGFSGLPMMLRRSSIALTGLINTNIVCSDTEFSFKATSVANIAWYIGIVSINIVNPLSNTIKYSEQLKKDKKKLMDYYDYIYIKKNKSNTTIYHIKYLFNILYRNLSLKKSKTNLQAIGRYSSNTKVSSDINEVFLICDQWLKNHNSSLQEEFLYRA
ncbi:glycosyltransferase [Pseudanabaena biceps]|nr:glycosyltransferase [Pseudanabaena biceps]